MHGCVLQSTVMWKEHILTNAGMRVTVDRYVEGTHTYQCMPACYSRPLCGRNGINYQLIVYMLVVLICSRTK